MDLLKFTDNTKERIKAFIVLALVTVVSLSYGYFGNIAYQQT